MNLDLFSSKITTFNLYKPQPQPQPQPQTHYTYIAFTILFLKIKSLKIQNLLILKFYKEFIIKKDDVHKEL